MIANSDSGSECTNQIIFLSKESLPLITLLLVGVPESCSGVTSLLRWGYTACVCTYYAFAALTPALV